MLSWLTKLITPIKDSNDVEAAWLERDIEEAEVRDWIKHFVWEIVESDSIEDVNPDNFEVWSRLSDYQKGLAFYHLIGVVADTVGSAE